MMSDQSFPNSSLPASMQTSWPAIVLLHVHAAFTGSSSSRLRDPWLLVHVVEVGFTSDLFLHAAMTKNHEQYAGQLMRVVKICKPMAGPILINVR